MIRETFNRLTPSELKRFHRSCPLSYDRIWGRKFHLPNYRQTDYYNQDMINELWVDYLLAYGAGLYGFQDEVNNTAFSAFSQLLRYGKPVYFLEREFAEAFTRTKLPFDMMTTDINWKQQAFRVMIPKGTLTIIREGIPRNIIYLDIARIAKGEEIMIPKELRRELNFLCFETIVRSNGPYLKPFDQICGLYDLEGFLIVGHLDYRERQDSGYVLYASIKPWNAVTIQSLFEITERLKGMPSVVSDEADERLLERMVHLTIVILLYMSAVPIEYEPKVLRKKYLDGKHPISELVEAKFVGSSGIRPQMIQPPKPHSPGEPTGRTLPPHPVAGHWKRVPYGPKHSLRRLTWIHPYLTKQLPNEKVV